MRNTLAIMIIAGAIALSASALWAGTQTRAKKQSRDGTGSNCRATEMTPALCVGHQDMCGNGKGGGKGQQQRKRDGSCLP